ncbi:helix-turn-helix domain-containing protein [Achromobacter sp. MFA1 R4]|uniref:helix-turn-helix domain-containing protein n=1 Tax=Achromobacter sp. MFA1 R4 TaxID=1881016 RepID=UPI00095379D2|nr:helix-turn-helix domain-containing protein [Achromobacter sp. MFA1 R4]SIT03878.1 CRP/FNR family transcriptional regulator, anaerobic regulatory protein [Achromobacter sp. MFA1 R4]
MTMTFFASVQPAASLPHKPSVSCTDCRLRGCCLPRRLNDPEVASLSDCIDTRVRLKKGEVLFSQHDSHRAVFAVRAGSLKTHWSDPCKPGQVAGVHLPGDLLGFSGLFDRRHGMTATALESSEVCVIRLDTLDALTPQFPQIQSQIRGFMSGELIRLQKLLAQTRQRSGPRIASFVLDLAGRHAALGYAPDSFSLRMTYSDIASMLGMTLATVSRLMNILKREDIIDVQGRQLRIVDRVALTAIAKGRDDVCRLPT